MLNSVPFEVYSLYRRGTPAAALANAYGVSVMYVEERVEAVRLMLENQVRIEVADGNRSDLPTERSRAEAAHPISPSNLRQARLRRLGPCPI